MKARKFNIKNPINQHNDLFNHDVWKAEDIGCKPDTVNSTYLLNFKRIEQDWLKLAVKRFVYYQASTKSFSSCYSYLARLIQFSSFLSQFYPAILPNEINRSVILKYIHHLAKLELSISTRSIALIHLRTFHIIMLQEKWLPLTKDILVYAGDLPKNFEKIPKFIPEYVLNQLVHHLHHLPDYLQHLVTVLLETGRRIGEICRMPLECLQKDDNGGYFLTVHETKLKRSYLLPISDSCTKAIKSQQELVKNDFFINRIYLFPSRTKLKTPHVSRRNVNGALNRLAVKENIVDENGNIWKFHSHQFRHTVGTRMINAGVSQTIVQRYLGHESAEMTARYAHIHDETLKNAFNEYQGKLIDIKGKVQYNQPQAKQDDANWLRYNTMSQALPNGLCGLPSPQQRCPHANACLTCVNFRTHKKYLPAHKSQLEATNQIIETAKTNGWQRQAEMNTVVKKNLEIIIQKLENE